MLLQTFAHIECQVEAGEIRIRIFEQLDDAQTLLVMIEAAVAYHAFCEHFFARMSERRMPEIVGKRDRFRQIFIKRQCPRDCPADRRNFNGMR